MKTKTAYAIVNKTKIKYSSRLSFALFDERLPIYWVKKVAEQELVERNLQDKYQVIQLYIPI